MYEHVRQYLERGYHIFGQAEESSIALNDALDSSEGFSEQWAQFLGLLCGLLVAVGSTAPMRSDQVTSSVKMLGDRR